jgi:plasmid stability protein
MAAEQPQDKYVLRLPDGMRDRLKDAAARNGRSMNAEILARLEDFESSRELWEQTFQSGNLRRELEASRLELEAQRKQSAEAVSTMRRIIDGFDALLRTAASGNDEELRKMVKFYGHFVGPRSDDEK